MKKHVITAMMILVIIFSLEKSYQRPYGTQVIIIFDASKSMAEKVGKFSKMDLAKKALRKIINRLYHERYYVQTGLRVYGHLNKKCDNSELILPIRNSDSSVLSNRIETIQPVGRTPLTFALQQAEQDFDYSRPGEKVIILVTDGLENCSGNPCLLAQKMKKHGKITKIHVVSLGMTAGHIKELKCITEPSGGILISASQPEKLYRKIFHVIGPLIDKNLIVITQNENQEALESGIEIYRGSEKIFSSGGKKNEFKLQQGIYDIKVFYPAADQVTWIPQVKIERGQTVVKEITFKNSKLRLRFKDTGNNNIYAEYEILIAGTRLSVAAGRKMGYVNVLLVPGKYDLKVIDPDTRDEIQFPINLKSGESKFRKIAFKRSRLNITVKDFIGNPLDFRCEIFSHGAAIPQAGVTGRDNAGCVLLPGSYDLRVTELRSLRTILIKNLILKDGDNEKKEMVLLSDGRLHERQPSRMDMPLPDWDNNRDNNERILRY